MPNSTSSRQSPQILVKEILEKMAHLERVQLEQLHQHVGDLLALLSPPQDSLIARHSPSKKPLPKELVGRSSDELEFLRGVRGGGSIEWKYIRQGKKSYGPYPYWRFWMGSTHCSIYLKQFARECRQAKQQQDIANNLTDDR